MDVTDRTAALEKTIEAALEALRTGVLAAYRQALKEKSAKATDAVNNYLANRISGATLVRQLTSLYNLMSVPADFPDTLVTELQQHWERFQEVISDALRRLQAGFDGLDHDAATAGSNTTPGGSATAETVAASSAPGLSERRLSGSEVGRCWGLARSGQ